VEIPQGRFYGTMTQQKKKKDKGYNGDILLKQEHQQSNRPPIVKTTSATNIAQGPASSSRDATMQQ